MKGAIKRGGVEKGEAPGGKRKGMPAENLRERKKSAGGGGTEKTEKGIRIPLFHPCSYLQLQHLLPMPHLLFRP